MPTNKALHDLPPRGGVGHIEDSLAQLNMRIARLSMLLGATLATEADMTDILNRDTEFYKLRRGNSREHALNPAEDRLLNEWEELRSLLVMRCDLMARTLADLGMEKTRQIIANVEARLESAGFRHDADGFNLRRRIDADQ